MTDPTDELEQVIGLPVEMNGYDPDDGEWLIVFSGGRALLLSAGDEAYFQLSERPH